jgi:hypothetical protein
MDTASRERLMKLIAMVGSDHDGEVVNAARAADKLLRQNKTTWHDLLAPNGHNRPLVAVLQRELVAARRENQLLRTQLATQPSPFAQSGENHAVQAQWALDLHYTDGIALRTFELEFLESIAARPWPLTERQQPVFIRIMLKVRRLSGRTPP